MTQDSSSAGALVGRVAAMVRYPVKSARGQLLHHAALSETGLAGDRRFAVVDHLTGRVASAKNPRLWRALLSVTASLPIAPAPGDEPPAPGDEPPASADEPPAEQASGDQVRMAFPDGTTLTGVGGALDEALSGLLGRPVRLTGTPPSASVLDRAVPEQVFDAGLNADVEVEAVTMGQASPPGTFVDYAPIHLLTTATVDHVGDLVGHRVDPTRYRPNLVIDTSDAGAGFVENHWVGRVVAIGDTVRLQVIMATPRCAVPTLDHGNGRDLDAVRALATHNRLDLPGFGRQSCAGVYAHVLRAGTITDGDPVRLLDPTEVDR